MTLLKMEGFESLRYTSDILSAVDTDAISYPAGRWGGNCFRSVGTGSGAVHHAKTAMQVGGLSAFSFGMGHQYVGTPSDNHQWLQLREGATVHLGLRFNAASNIELVRGDGTVLATTSATFNRTAWHHVGMDVVIDDAAGAVTLYMNGVAALSVSGVDTRNGGTGIVNDVYLATHAMSSSIGHQVDDWYVCDTVDATATQLAPNNTFLGDCKVEMGRPNGNGAVNAWVGSDANSVDNYLLVDDVSTTTDYVGSNVAGAQDLYQVGNTMAAPVGGAVQVLAMQLTGMAAKSDAGAATDLLGLYRDADGTTVSEVLVPAAALSTTYSWFTGAMRFADPDGLPWTQATADAIQIGVEVGA